MTHIHGLVWYLLLRSITCYILLDVVTVCFFIFMFPIYCSLHPFVTVRVIGSYLPLLISPLVKVCVFWIRYLLLPLILCRLFKRVWCPDIWRYLRLSVPVMCCASPGCRCRYISVLVLMSHVIWLTLCFMQSVWSQNLFIVFSYLFWSAYLLRSVCICQWS